MPDGFARNKSLNSHYHLEG